MHGGTRSKQGAARVGDILDGQSSKSEGAGL